MENDKKLPKIGEILPFSCGNPTKMDKIRNICRKLVNLATFGRLCKPKHTFLMFDPSVLEFKSGPVAFERHDNTYTVYSMYGVGVKDTTAPQVIKNIQI